METHVKLPKVTPGLIWLLLAGIAIIGVAGYGYFLHGRGAVRLHACETLAAVADLKADEISSWYRDRQGNAGVIFESQVILSDVGEALASPPDSPVGAKLQAWMNSLHERYDYDSVELFDARGQLRISAPAKPTASPADVEAEVRQALLAQNVMTSDLHRDPESGAIIMEFLVPVGLKGDAGKPADGVLRLRVNPYHRLYPLVQLWPTSSVTAETVLVRRETNTVLILNDRREAAHAALTMRVSLAETNRPAVRAVLGQESFFEGRDYRGKAVLSVARRISGLPWVMETKVDMAEVDAPLRKRAELIGGMTGALNLAMVAGVTLLHRRRQLRFVQRALSLERQQQEIEGRFQEIFHHSPAAIWEEDFSAVKRRFDEWRAAGVTDLRKHLASHPEEVRALAAMVRVVKVNDGVLKLLGIEAGKPAREFSRYLCGSQKSLASLQEEMLALAEGRREFQSEAVISTTTGAEKILQYTTAVPKGYEDSLARVLVSAVDLTERHRLHAEQARLAAIVEFADDAIIGKDLNGTITNWNRGAEQLFGYTAQEMIGMPLARLIPPERQGEEEEILARLQQGRSVAHFESARLNKAGECIEVSVTISPVRDKAGNIIGASKIVRDITERKRAVQRIADGLNFNLTLLRAAPVGIIVFKASGPCVSANAAAARMIGGTKEQILLQNFRQLESWQRSGLLEIAETVLATQKEQQRDVHLNTSFGQDVWMSCRLVPFQFEGEDHLLFVAGDVTQRKAHEQEIERLNRLYATLSQINQSIVRVRSRAELFAEICRVIIEFGRFRMTWIGRLNSHTREVTVEAQHGDAGGYLKEIRVTADDQAEGHGIVGTSIREGRTCVSNDFLGDPNLKPWHEAAARQGFAAAISVPIRLDHEVCGALAVYATEKNFFGEKEVALMEEAAQDICFALDHLQGEQRRELVEAALRQSEEKFRLLVESSPDGILVQTNGRFAYVNEAAIRLFGAQAADDLLGHLVLDYFHPDFRELARERIRAINAEKKLIPRIEEKILQLDGTSVFVEVSAVPVHFLGSDGALVFMRDISERKQAEELNRQLMVAIDQSADAILFTDASGNILYVNRGFEAITGYSRGEVLGKNPRLLKSGRHAAEFYRNLWETINQGQVWQGQITNRRKDGTIYEETANITPVTGVDGKIVSFVAVKRDITHELQLERQLFEAQKLEAVGQLAGGVAHDYNNILAASMIQLTLLLEAPDLKPEMRAALEMLKRGAARAANLTRQLLLFSRRQAPQKRPVELNALLDDEFKMLRRLLGENLVLTIQAQGGEAWIEADPSMIEQVVMNLCINARDAMPNGGPLTVGIQLVTLDTAMAAKNAEARPGKFACLSVADAGCGMSAETLQRIFEPFFTTKEVGRGTGLGLATVYGIVKQHAGWIEVTSEVGKGSEFRVFLPASDPAAPLSASYRPPAIRCGTGTILVVEDDELLRGMLVKSLKFAGYRVFESADGQEALTLWKERINLVDLLLTDMVMPGGVDGLALIRVFKLLKPALPVILMSGYNQELEKNGLPTGQGITFLSKPCDLENLTATVCKALGQSRQQRPENQAM